MKNKYLCPKYFLFVGYALAENQEHQNILGVFSCGLRKLCLISKHAIKNVCYNMWKYMTFYVFVCA